MSVFIREYTTLCASGFGSEAFARALKRECPPTVAYKELKGDPLPPPMPYLKADLAPLKEFVPPRVTRRMDTFGRIALLLGSVLLKDVPPEERGDLGLIVATGYGSFTTNMDFLNTITGQTHAGASPMLFSSTVHNSAMAAVAIHFGIQGPACTLSMFEASLGGAFVLGEAWVASGQARQVLVLAADDVPHLAAYYESRTGPEPDPSRPETLLAEGGAGFLLGGSGRLRLVREEFRPAGTVFGGCGEGSISHARAYGRIACAPGFELGAAALHLETGAGPKEGIAVDFSHPDGRPLFYRLAIP